MLAFNPALNRPFARTTIYVAGIFGLTIFVWTTVGTETEAQTRHSGTFSTEPSHPNDSNKLTFRSPGPITIDPQSTFMDQPLPPTPSAPQFNQTFIPETDAAWETADSSDVETVLLPAAPTAATFTQIQDPGLRAEAVSNQPIRLEPVGNSNSQIVQNNLRSAVPMASSGSARGTDVPEVFDSKISSYQMATIESPIEPVTYSRDINTPTQNNPPQDTALAKQLIGRYLVDQAADPLPGEPIRLLDLLRVPLGSDARQSMVSQYWETWYDWSTLLSRTEHQNWLNSLQTPASNTDVALLRAARSAASDMVLAARIQLGKSQSKLSDFMPNQNDSRLPLPADEPLIQKYKTNYELYRAHQMMPDRFRGIDQMLPRSLELIVQRANTVALAKSATDAAGQAFSARQTDLATILEAARVWRSAEQDLIATVTRYNQAIADYSLTITGGSLPPERMVAMLIAPPRRTNHQTLGQNQRQSRGAGQSNSGPPRSVMSSGDSLPAGQGRFQSQQDQFRSPQVSPSGSQFASGNSFGSSSESGTPANQPPRQPAARSANQSFGQFGNGFER